MVMGMKQKPCPILSKTKSIAFHGQGVIGVDPLWLLGIDEVLVGELGMWERPFCTILCVVLLVRGCKFPFFDD